MRTVRTSRIALCSADQGVVVNRPQRQLKVLQEKIADKSSRPRGAKGKRVKRWKKWAEKYKSLVV